MKNPEGDVSMHLTRLQEFIQFCIDQGAIQFGEFTLKSGRFSPYFFNSGKFCTGISTQRLASAYTLKIMEERIHPDMMFGPAYKGIPLVVSIAQAYAIETGKDMPWAFDRKEEKDHGDQGLIVGTSISGMNLYVLDDVITSGITQRDTAKLIEKFGGNLMGIGIAFDRQEKDADSELTAVQKLSRELDVPVLSAITLDDLINYFEILDPAVVVGRHNKGEYPVTVRDALLSIRKYQVIYGA